MKYTVRTSTYVALSCQFLLDDDLAGVGIPSDDIRDGGRMFDPGVRMPEEEPSSFSNRTADARGIIPGFERQQQLPAATERPHSNFHTRSEERRVGKECPV